MATHQLAKGLASLGRHGDTMLMHVSPSEVEGLKALGAMTGRRVTTNPHTGMPEAFSFGDFLSSLLPTAAGFLMGGPAGAAMGLKGTAATIAPIAAGVATGAAVAGAKGEDVLAGGLMGGLGGFGGSNIAKTLGGLGAQGGYQVGQAIPAGEAITTAAGKEALNMTNPLLGAPGTVNPALVSAPTTTAAASLPTYSEGLSQIGRGAQTALADPMGAGLGAIKQAVPSLGMAALSGAQKDLYPEADTSMEEKRKAEENKYKDPRTGLLNLAQARPDFGTALALAVFKTYMVLMIKLQVLNN
ncbi:hypothetical protein EB001_13700 [bacterium]|nr:hypothetical protein [bacterium]